MVNILNWVSNCYDKNSITLLLFFSLNRRSKLWLFLNLALHEFAAMPFKSNRYIYISKLKSTFEFMVAFYFLCQWKKRYRFFDRKKTFHYKLYFKYHLIYLCLFSFKFHIKTMVKIRIDNFKKHYKNTIIFDTISMKCFTTIWFFYVFLLKETKKCFLSYQKDGRKWLSFL